MPTNNKGYDPYNSAPKLRADFPTHLGFPTGARLNAEQILACYDTELTLAEERHEDRVVLKATPRRVP